MYYDYVSFTGHFFSFLKHQYLIFSFILFSLLFPTAHSNGLNEIFHLLNLSHNLSVANFSSKNYLSNPDLTGCSLYTCCFPEISFNTLSLSLLCIPFFPRPFSFYLMVYVLNTLKNISCYFPEK